MKIMIFIIIIIIIIMIFVVIVIKAIELLSIYGFTRAFFSLDMTPLANSLWQHSQVERSAHVQIISQSLFDFV